MQSVIVHTGTDAEAVRSSQATRHIPASHMPVTASKTLTALERVGVYREMYWLRLREALSVDYPALKKYLGDERFDQLCDAYCRKHPSHSYSLNRLGDHFPRFIAASPMKRRAFLTDLARLELMMTEVFDAGETQPLSKAGIAAIPADAWERIRFRPIEALRHGAFRYPVSEFLRAKRNREAFTRRKDSWIVVSRRDYTVRNLELTRSAYKVFTALCAGKPLGRAVTGARTTGPQIQEWFKTWVAHGLFQEAY
jgi:hypothetical protein